ncbi:hypothetical protein JHK87_049350 [Glycine soja]|nr:hypothetical protein JHK87_049350 [Glycine soja]
MEATQGFSFSSDYLNGLGSGKDPSDDGGGGDMYKNSSKGVESSCTAINVEAAFTITNKKDTLIEGENSPPNDEVVTKSNGELHGDWDPSSKDKEVSKDSNHPLFRKLLLTCRMQCLRMRKLFIKVCMLRSVMPPQVLTLPISFKVEMFPQIVTTCKLKGLAPFLTLLLSMNSFHNFSIISWDITGAMGRDTK